ncbi:hypothetical protein GGX14DRAFT_575712 [Mycena pura]|uniref:Uncharacterized protein n=1 Tax=Mycena pura TaxID=153505 RepID=A0AAD6UUF5_9AGAR|nr:hypothetical protein GGX14DRAFT_575712 [Mycena pura]
MSTTQAKPLSAYNGWRMTSLSSYSDWIGPSRPHCASCEAAPLRWKAGSTASKSSIIADFCGDLLPQRLESLLEQRVQKLSQVALLGLIVRRGVDPDSHAYDDVPAWAGERKTVYPLSLDWLSTDLPAHVLPGLPPPACPSLDSWPTGRPYPVTCLVAKGIAETNENWLEVAGLCDELYAQVVRYRGLHSFFWLSEQLVQEEELYDNSEQHLAGTGIAIIALSAIEAHTRRIARRKQNRVYLCRPQLLPYPRLCSPWQVLYLSGSDRAYITM